MSATAQFERPVEPKRAINPALLSVPRSDRHRWSDYSGCCKRLTKSLTPTQFFGFVGGRDSLSAHRGHTFALERVLDWREQGEAKKHRPGPNGEQPNKQVQKKR